MLSGCGSSVESNQNEIMISAASSMTESLLELKDAFEAEYPHLAVTYNFGGSGTLRKQIEQGAPIDLFFSASMKDYQILQETDLIKVGIVILENSLVMIKSNDESFDTLQSFLDQDGMMAIGTPEAVPAGTYAKEALEQMEIWSRLQERFVYTKDVRQVVTLVSEGAVDAGIVYSSDVSNIDEVTIFENIDSSHHAPIEYTVAVIKNGSEEKTNSEAIEKFYQFVQTERAIDIFKENGFLPKAGE